MSIFDRFANQFGSQFSTRFGQNVPGQGAIGQNGFDTRKRPQTMEEWKSYVDGLSRYERDQLYPGMHKDLIPATEMIEASVAGAGGTQVYANMPDRRDSENMPGGKDPRSIEHENPQCKYIRAEARELHRDVVRYREQKQAIGRTIKKHKDEIARLSAYYGF